MGMEVILRSPTEKQVCLMPICCPVSVIAGILVVLRSPIPRHSQLHFGLCLISTAKVVLCAAISQSDRSILSLLLKWMLTSKLSYSLSVNTVK